MVYNISYTKESEWTIENIKITGEFQVGWNGENEITRIGILELYPADIDELAKIIIKREDEKRKKKGGKLK